MSNALAIAAVTAVLKDLLNNAVIDHNLSTTVGQPVTVTALPPDRIKTGDDENPQLNLFLYNVSPNTGWRNAQLPSRDGQGDRVTNPPLALDLHYLLTAYGKSDFDGEILLGYAMQMLHETPVLPREAIRKALGSPPPVDSHILPIGPLAAADLADQVEQIKIVPASMNTEELSKLWTALQAHYRPTAGYHVSVVLVESRQPTKATLPVRERLVYVTPFQHPLIESVESAAGKDKPIVADSTLLINGSQLRGDNTTVWIGGVKFIPTLANMSANRIQISLPPMLPDVLRAAIQVAQVVHEIDMGEPPTSHRGVESNAVAFVLHPKITIPATASGNLTITFDPRVGRAQRVTLSLGERNPPPDRPARNFDISGPPDNGITVPLQLDTDTITFSLQDVIAGQYFVRLRVDGAESVLEVDPNTLEYIGPMITIT